MGLSQAAYIEKLLSRLSMDNSKKGLLPFWHGLAFSKFQCPKIQEEKSRMEGIRYALAVRSLMYTILCNRPNICLTVGMVTRY